MRDLFFVLPSEFSARAKVQFCGPTGTDAVEAALKLVKTATGRSDIAAFHGAYHGMSRGSLALMGNLGAKHHVGGLNTNVTFFPFLMTIVALSGSEARRDIFKLWQSEEDLRAWRTVAILRKVGRMRRIEVQKHVVARSGPPFKQFQARVVLVACQAATS
jgi:4-aminobutyrate aminotransferase-like enzyme